ncbi:MAG: hypothetical protein FJ096_05235 [Deltaproteobacteria bacterium]|nr:hypothetical protein [Deltaproteobacteria bacterium]
MSERALAMGLLGSLLLVVGCEGRTPQCNRFVDSVNHAQARMGDILVTAGGPNPTAPSLEAYAKAHDDLVVKLRALKLGDKKLAGYRDRYLALAQGLAEATRKTAAKLESPEAQKAADEVKAFTPKKRELEKEVNDYCRGRDD